LIRDESALRLKIRKEVKMVSQKQLIANRENAKKSTGPNDTSLTRLNALKHGILSEEVLLKGEKKKDLEELGRKLRQELTPQGELEIILVDWIVSNIWRLKRALKVETALMSYEYESGLYDDWNKRPRDERLALKDMLVESDNDVVQRYETTIERQFYRALHELIRLQAAHKREKPPAPIAVDVDLNKE
jgi:dephospho-CoA kinase